MSNYGWDEPLVDRTPESVRPQPGDCSLLWGENKHRATLVWRDPHACKALKLRQRSSCLEWSSKYEGFLRECRLLPAVHLLGSTPCKEFVIALIERWRPETNTFHLIQGEATITLEDVEVLTGLPTDGVPVTVAVDRRDSGVICEELLGARPPAGSCTGQSVTISWVKGMFDRLPAGAPADIVLRYARAYTWVLLGAILLADRTGDLIPVHLLRLIGDSAVASTFSWGSAVLAWLYKAMGRAAFFTAGSQRGTGDLGGFTLLVQLWALERFPIIADRYVAGGDPPDTDTVPRGVRWMSVIRRHQHRMAMNLEEIRYALDRCTWMPYAFREEDYQLEDDVLWRAVCPMLCIDCVAWHHPDRCMRQFGHGQRIPQDAEPAHRVEELLGLDFRAPVHDWGARYLQYLRLWEQRDQHIAEGEVRADPLSHHFHDEYDE
ncbi:Serine/threonine-protein phosphatase 7 long form homolog [Linum perenne]